MLVTDQERLKKDIQKLAAKYDGKRSALLPILEHVQQKDRHVGSYAMQVIADQLGIHPVEVYSVVSFYSFLSSRPQGKFVVRLCRTISCDLAGKDRVARQLQNELGIGFGETTADGHFTLEWTNCVGMCDQGPAMLVNDQVFTKVTPDRVDEIIQLCRRSFSVYAMQEEEVH